MMVSACTGNLNKRTRDQRGVYSRFWIALFVLFVTLVTSLPALAAPPTLPLDLNQGWTLKTQGPWRIRYDHRELLAMWHPWQESAKGNFASASREIEVPKDWQGPVFLSLYCSDDYHTDAWRPDGSWLTADGFIGHRVKQVLADDRVVWNADVSDAVVQGESPQFRIELPLKPGQKCLLTLLVYDLVESKTATPNDFYQSANNEKKRENDPDAPRFQTHVYWGDLTLTNSSDALPRGERPSEKKVRNVHTEHWPLPPFGDPWTGPIAFEIAAPAGIPKQGFPLESGVPIHAAKLKDVQNCVLKGTRDAPIPSQKSVLGRWPDDSLQWVLFDLPVMPGQTQTSLSLTRDASAFPAKISAKDSDKGITLDAGAVQFDAGAGNVLVKARAKRNPAATSAALTLESDGEPLAGTVESASVVTDGPFRGTVEINGRFSALDHSVASFRAYCSAYANLPYLKLWIRLFNDTALDLPVSGLKLKLTLAAPPQSLRVPSGEAELPFTLSQTSEKARDLNGTEVGAKPPVFAAWNGGVVAVRNFRELFPKQLSAAGSDITVDLISGGKSPIVFTPGEAKSHEVWLALGDVDPAQFAATVSSPPFLQNAAYFCATGAFGPARPHDGVPVLHDHMTQDFAGKQWEDLGQSFGVRDFPDSPYHGGLPKWCNNYYERMLNLWSEWVMSGDAAWRARAIDECRHIMDVAIVHSAVPNHDWLGAMHGPGANHVEGPWNPNLRVAGLYFYQKLMGDRDARDAFVGVADYCLRVHAGLDSPSIRDHAGPFDAICTAFQETGDVKYLDEGAARVAATLKHMDQRRGVWPEEHGSKVYRGNVPWMAAQLGRPLYLWYRATGDVQAAQALVGLAESIVCENTDWDHPGVVSGYSHNPRYTVSTIYDPLIIPIIFAAYELTGDSFFLDAAAAQWERWTREKAFDSPLNCHWNTPWLVWQLKHYNVLSAR